MHLAFLLRHPPYSKQHAREGLEAALAAAACHRGERRRRVRRAVRRLGRHGGAQHEQRDAGAGDAFLAFLRYL